VGIIIMEIFAGWEMRAPSGTLAERMLKNTIMHGWHPALFRTIHMENQRAFVSPPRFQIAAPANLHLCALNEIAGQDKLNL